MEKIVTKAKILALRDVEIQMYRILEKGELISFDNMKETLVALEGLYKSEEKLPKEKQCEQGHQCSSNCRREGCPCQEDHCCSNSQSPCGEVEDCAFCASKVSDLADLVNDNLNER